MQGQQAGCGHFIAGTVLSDFLMDDFLDAFLKFFYPFLSVVPVSTYMYTVHCHTFTEAPAMNGLSFE
jgi:hypothetical protein